MRSLAEIETLLLQPLEPRQPAHEAAAELLAMGEEVLSHWLVHKEQVPTLSQREGFRLLALHRQGCKNDPSFNACRETCRELVYYHNLIQAAPAAVEVASYLQSAKAIAYHLCLFVGGKVQDPELGEFCCSSRSLRTDAAVAEEVRGV